MDLYVATNGKDGWSGRRPTPNRKKTDGPMATIQGARDLIRRLKGSGLNNRAPEPPGALSEPITVWIRGGIYPIRTPIVFGPEDSYPVTYTAYGNEKPILDGGERITGWTVTKVKGRTAWVADLPEVAEGRWSFRQLFVNGRRASRPRWPRQELFRMVSSPELSSSARGWGPGGQTQFICRPGDVQPFANLTDIEVVYLHFWIEERSPIAAFDPATNLVTMARPSCSAFTNHWTHGHSLADYYLDNVFEELAKPGEWYLDRSAGRLFYLPRKGETPDRTEVVAPRCVQLLAVLGKPDEGHYVEFVRFKDLTFRHTDWRHPSDDGVVPLGSSTAANFSSIRRYHRGNKAGAPQAANDVPGVITLEAARGCAVEDCVIEHAGWYGIEIGDACRNIRLVGNTIRDLGAGGIKINGAAAADKAVHRRTGHHRITDNTIVQGGRVFHSAVGILAMNACRLLIAHNHIRDLFYTGISCGWEWGYQESVSRDNWIENNHIHQVGQGMLSDLGGIYTLGVQPGTRIRGNLIHDVHCASYGGWCIYPDEGSSHILIENNICYDADRQAFHQHYGRENIVRNNIFAFGEESVIHYTRADDHNGLTFEKNILLTNGRPVFSSRSPLTDKKMRSDLNLVFDVSGKSPFCKTGKKLRISWKGWRQIGFDIHSLVADPKFRNWKRRDFRLKPGSPAFKMGFVPFEGKDVGPRPPSLRD